MAQFISTTNTFVLKNDQVLLLHRDKNLENWPDVYMGPGGKQETDESVQDAAIREVKEETGLDVKNIRLRAVATNYYPHKDKVYLVFIFLADYQAGKLKRGKEGTLEWIQKDEVVKLPKLYTDLKTHCPIVFKDEPKVVFTWRTFNEENEMIKETISPEV